MMPDARPASLPEQYGRLVSASLPCPELTLSDFFRHARGLPRFYWRAGRSGTAFAGFGAAVELFAYGPQRFEAIQTQAAQLFAGALHWPEDAPVAAPRLFGGFSFRDDFVPDVAWSDFPPAHFVLPHYQISEANGQRWLSIHAQIPCEEDPGALLPELFAALEARVELIRAGEQTPLAAPHLLELRYPMTLETWTEKIEAATARMRAGEVKKVVLARACEIRFDDHADVDAALLYLAHAYPDTYRFAFEPRPYHAFYGATPELLLRTQGAQLETMALAGSIRRGGTPAEDEALAAELLASSKDRYEHQLVADEIEARLNGLGAQVRMGATGIMQLSNIQHLHTPITATMPQARGVLPLLAVLHPTPALGGQPRDEAMAIIGASEPVPRGWFGGPVGWLDAALDGEFGVAIRSAVAQDRRVWAYAGAGIVAESEPRKEWDETALKFRPMLEALGLSRDLIHGQS